jgi:hypothetical protein
MKNNAKHVDARPRPHAFLAWSGELGTAGDPQSLNADNLPSHAAQNEQHLFLLASTNALFLQRGKCIIKDGHELSMINIYSLMSRQHILTLVNAWAPCTRDEKCGRGLF